METASGHIEDPVMTATYLKGRVLENDFELCAKHDTGLGDEPLEFRFLLLSQKVEQIDILESTQGDVIADVAECRSSISDVFERLRLLESAPRVVTRIKKLAFISLSSSTSSAQGKYVIWDGPRTASSSKRNFEVSGDCESLTILKSGIYEVYVRLSQMNTADKSGFSLLVNGKIVSLCIQSDMSHGYQFTTQVAETVILDAMSVLAVRRRGANGAIRLRPSHHLQTRFSVRLLQRNSDDEDGEEEAQAEEDEGNYLEEDNDEDEDEGEDGDEEEEEEDEEEDDFGKPMRKRMMFIKKEQK